jgi:hypothetical protein
MKLVFDRPDLARKVGRVASKDVATRFSPKAVVDTMLQRIGELLWRQQTPTTRHI